MKDVFKRIKKVISGDNSTPNIQRVMKDVDAQIGRAVTQLSDR